MKWVVLVIGSTNPFVRIGVCRGPFNTFEEAHEWLRQREDYLVGRVLALVEVSIVEE